MHRHNTVQSLVLLFVINYFKASPMDESARVCLTVFLLLLFFLFSCRRAVMDTLSSELTHSWTWLNFLTPLQGQMLGREHTHTHFQTRHWWCEVFESNHTHTQFILCSSGRSWIRVWRSRLDDVYTGLQTAMRMYTARQVWSVWDLWEHWNWWQLLSTTVCRLLFLAHLPLSGWQIVLVKAMCCVCFMHLVFLLLCIQCVIWADLFLMSFKVGRIFIFPPE